MNPAQRRPTTRFLHEIGFLSKRKQTVSQPQNHPQAARYDHIPLSRELVDRLAPTNDNLRRALLLTLSLRYSLLIASLPLRFTAILQRQTAGE